MATAQISQYDLEFGFTGSSTINVSGFDVDFVWNLPSQGVEVSGLDLEYVTDFEAHDIQASQYDLEYVYRGRVDDPKVRCFTFTLDGHDFYVIRLGTIETLLFDTQTEQFYIWGSGDGLLWRAYDGCNWLGGYPQAAAFGSNIVVGDDGAGTIYFLNPDADRDDDALEGTDLPRDFLRRTSGQVVTKGYGSVRCYGLELLGSIGQSDSGATPTVTLNYSDDRGQTYVDAGTFTLTPEDYGARLFWRSLGSVRVPGRIFRIEDYGALKRIDSLTMVAEGEGEV